VKFDEIIEVNGQKLTKKYIQSLSKQERLCLVEPIFNILRNNGFIYPDDKEGIDKEWKRLLEYQPDINIDILFNNSSLATNICKYFCHSFYSATEKGKPTIIDNFNNDDILKMVIKNRLGLDWLDISYNSKGEEEAGVNEAFNLSFKMIVFQGQRSKRTVNATSLFKPDIAKYLVLKYSQEKDNIYDPSAGFGGRLLGTKSLPNRRYIATDPLTVPELQKMVEYFKFSDCDLYQMGSEDFILDSNSIDFCFTSPPYLSQEVYSQDISQAYNKGQEYFYDIYWHKTLNNIKKGLKSNKIFALNIHERYNKMINMAKECFGEPIEMIKLRTVKSHLTKSTKTGIEKFEPVFIFKNIK
jgi:hypothetical protein